LGLGYLSDKISLRVVISLSCFGSALSCILLWGFATNGGVLVAFVIVFGLLVLSFSALWTKLITIIARQSDEDRTDERPFEADHGFCGCQVTIRRYHRCCSPSLPLLAASVTSARVSLVAATVYSWRRLEQLIRHPYAGPISTALLKYSTMNGSVGGYGEQNYVGSA
jgi:hypothetical protein